MDKREFFTKAIRAARDADHVWPEFAACEAALESAWGESRLARMANNLFGQKTGFSTTGVETIDIATHEVLTPAQVTRVSSWKHGLPEKRTDGNFDAVVDATWPKFSTWADSFKARMELLRRASVYHDALNAPTGSDFVEEVSKHWATDPERAHKVLVTYHANEPLIMQIQGIGV